MKLSDPEAKALLQAARSASENAYAPYSKIRVGAAVRCRDGSVYIGCNVENSSYGATICAERSAISCAVADGKKAFEAIAVFSPDIKNITPCGICRQFIAEFGAETVVITESSAVPVKTLLPETFLL